jgi:hypothetical protein
MPSTSPQPPVLTRSDGDEKAHHLHHLTQNTTVHSDLLRWPRTTFYASIPPIHVVAVYFYDRGRSSTLEARLLRRGACSRRRRRAHAHASTFDKPHASNAHQGDAKPRAGCPLHVERRSHLPWPTSRIARFRLKRPSSSSGQYQSLFDCAVLESYADLPPEPAPFPPRRSA